MTAAAPGRAAPALPTAHPEGSRHEASYAMDSYGTQKRLNLLQQEEGREDQEEGDTVCHNPDHQVGAAGLQGNKTG